MCFEREVRILQTIRHPNIVALVDVLYTEALIYVVMEYCTGGDVLSAIHLRGCLDDFHCRRYFRDCLLGLAHLHARAFAHRDIKPENVLIDTDGTAKLADFGLSHELADRLLSTPCGSVAYCAPEVVRGESYDGARIDVWSLGVCLYAMCSGRLPWTSPNEFEICTQIVSGNFAMPMVASNGAKDVMRRMLALEPAERPTVAELLRDPWVEGIARPRGILESRSAWVVKVRQAKATGHAPQGNARRPSKAPLIVRPQVDGSRRGLAGSLSVVWGSIGARGALGNS
jgi:serine/threonine protein kinase